LFSARKDRISNYVNDWFRNNFPGIFFSCTNLALYIVLETLDNSAAFVLFSANKDSLSVYY